MRVYLLRRLTRDGHGNYDEAYGFVVIAASKKAARVMASKEAGDEGAPCWLSEDTATCVCIGHSNGQIPPGVVLQDFHAG